MGKVFALLFILLAAGAGYGGYLTHNNIATYNQFKPQALDAISESLGDDLQLSCHTDISLFGAIQKDICTIYSDGNRVITLWHHATIEPFRAYGEFGVDGQVGLIAMAAMLAPSIFEEQKGEWSISPAQHQVHYRYQTGAVNSDISPQYSLKVEPLVLEGFINLNGKLEAFSSLSLSQFLLKDKNSNDHITLRNIYTDIKGADHKGAFVAERSDFKLDLLHVEQQDNSLRINNIATRSVGTVNGKFSSSLSTLQFDNLSANHATHNLHMDKTEVSIFMDKMDLDAVLKMQGDDPLKGLMMLATQGLGIYLDNASTSFTYQDRRSGMLGTAGDFRLTGSVKFPTLADIPDDPLQLLDQVQAELNINASPSLSYGPQADIVMEFIATGWIENSTNRLTSKLELKEGVATINGLPVNALQLIPQYDEDH